MGTNIDLRDGKRFEAWKASANFSIIVNEGFVAERFTILVCSHNPEGDNQGDNLS